MDGLFRSGIRCIDRSVDRDCLEPRSAGIGAPWIRRTSSARYCLNAELTKNRMVSPLPTLQRSEYPVNLTMYLRASAPCAAACAAQSLSIGRSNNTCCQELERPPRTSDSNNCSVRRTAADARWSVRGRGAYAPQHSQFVPTRREFLAPLGLWRMPGVIRSASFDVHRDGADVLRSINRLSDASGRWPHPKCTLQSFKGSIVMLERNNPSIPKQEPVTPESEPPPVEMPPEVKDAPRPREPGEKNPQHT